uniref:Secreted protein n=1 Tax=Ixodes ricinus TaxID=34613 RepID=A0A147BAF8_IXORI
MTQSLRFMWCLLVCRSSSCPQRARVLCRLHIHRVMKDELRRLLDRHISPNRVPFLSGVSESSPAHDASTASPHVDDRGLCHVQCYGAGSASPTSAFSVLSRPHIEIGLEVATNDVTKAKVSRRRTSRSQQSSAEVTKKKRKKESFREHECCHVAIVATSQFRPAEASVNCQDEQWPVAERASAPSTTSNVTPPRSRPGT